MYFSYATEYCFALKVYLMCSLVWILYTKLRPFRVRRFQTNLIFVSLCLILVCIC